MCASKDSDSVSATTALSLDMDEAVADLRELRLLSEASGFDLAGLIKRVADNGTAHFVCEVDWAAAAATGRVVARYKLAEPLHVCLAALRAWNVEGDLVERVGHASPRLVSSAARGDKTVLVGEFGRWVAERCHVPKAYWAFRSYYAAILKD